jgi:hypothetical protein
VQLTLIISSSLATRMMVEVQVILQQELPLDHFILIFRPSEALVAFLVVQNRQEAAQMALGDMERSLTALDAT